MARPLRIEFENAFYHIIQRGIEKRNIFAQDSDKDKFLSYLSQSHIGYGAVIHAYMLLNNHYHLILQTPKANLSRIMHFLNTSYAAYFNAKRKRVGPLYQGRYKAILVQQDEYLHYLSRYIHLNPVRTGIVKDPAEYRWSSYKYFTSSKTPPRWLDTSFILSMFDSNVSKAKKSYEEFTLEGIGKEKDIIKDNMISSFVLGSTDFLENIEKCFIGKKEDYEIPQLKQIRCRKEPAMECIARVVQEEIPSNRRLEKKLSIYLSRKFTQRTLNEIAAFHGKIKYSGVSQVCRRAEENRREDKDFDRLLKKIEDAIMCNVKT